MAKNLMVNVSPTNYDIKGRPEVSQKKGVEQTQDLESDGLVNKWETTYKETQEIQKETGGIDERSFQRSFSSLHQAHARLSLENYKIKKSYLELQKELHLLKLMSWHWKSELHQLKTAEQNHSYVEGILKKELEYLQGAYTREKRFADKWRNEAAEVMDEGNDMKRRVDSWKDVKNVWMTDANVKETEKENRRENGFSHGNDSAKEDSFDDGNLTRDTSSVTENEDTAVNAGESDDVCSLEVGQLIVTDHWCVGEDGETFVMTTLVHRMELLDTDEDREKLSAITEDVEESMSYVYCKDGSIEKTWRQVERARENDKPSVSGDEDDKFCFSDGTCEEFKETQLDQSVEYKSVSAAVDKILEAKEKKNADDFEEKVKGEEGEKWYGNEKVEVPDMSEDIVLVICKDGTNMVFEEVQSPGNSSPGSSGILTKQEENEKRFLEGRKDYENYLRDTWNDLKLRQREFQNRNTKQLQLELKIKGEWKQLKEEYRNFQETLENSKKSKIYLEVDGAWRTLKFQEQFKEWEEKVLEELKKALQEEWESLQIAWKELKGDNGPLSDVQQALPDSDKIKRDPGFSSGGENVERKVVGHKDGEDETNLGKKRNEWDFQIKRLQKELDEVYARKFSRRPKAEMQVVNHELEPGDWSSEGDPKVESQSEGEDLLKPKCPIKCPASDVISLPEGPPVERSFPETKSAKRFPKDEYGLFDFIGGYQKAKTPSEGRYGSVEMMKGPLPPVYVETKWSRKSKGRKGMKRGDGLVKERKRPMKADSHDDQLVDILENFDARQH